MVSQFVEVWAGPGVCAGALNRVVIRCAVSELDTDHNQFIQKNPTRCNNVSKFYYSMIYMKLTMFRATHRPSSGP